MADNLDFAPDEIVYRRINATNHWWVNPDGSIDPAAMLPNKSDVDGLSLCRAQDAKAAGESGLKNKKFFVVGIRVADIEKHGMKLKADRPGHAYIEDLTYENRKSLAVQAERLASICSKWEGPYEGLSDPGKEH